MPSKYSVDEILEEVRRKKGLNEQPNAPKNPSVMPEKKPTERPAVPFRLTGLTDEFESPTKSETKSDVPLETPAFSEQKQAGLPFKSPLTEAKTRVDIPLFKPDRPIRAEQEDLGFTRVIPVEKPHDEQSLLEQRRKEKVRRFMEDSFSALESDPLDAPSSPLPFITHGTDQPLENEDAEGQISSLHQFFGGLRPNGAKKSAAMSADRTTDSRHTDSHDQNKPEPIEGEYKKPSDAPSVLRDTQDIKRSIFIRLVVTGVCFIILLYLSLCNLYPLPLYNPVCPEVDMRMYLMTNLAVMVVAAMASNNVIGNGLISLVTLRADYDTPAALAVLVSIAHVVAAIIAGDFLYTGQGSIYLSAAALGLVTNALGKHMTVSRIERNFSVVTADTERTGEYLISDHNLAAVLSEGLDLEEPVISYSSKTEFLDDFLRISYSEDETESLGHIAIPLFLFFSAGMALASSLLFKLDGMHALTVFCVAVCITSPLTGTIAGSLPLLRASDRLSREGFLLTGHETLEKFENVNAVLLEANELYPAGCVVLHGIKAFAQSRIDEAIIDAASVMCSVDGVLKEVFMGIIGGKTSILKPVDAVVFDDGLGMSAEVDGKTVLIGNRELMIRRNVDAPSRDFEKRFIKSNREILYLANSGEVTAMFVLSYKPSPDMLPQINALERQGINLIVRSSDPNIIVPKIASDFGFPEEWITLVPAEVMNQSIRYTAPRARGMCHIAGLSGASARLRTLAAVHTVRRANRTGILIQLTGLVLGYALTAFLAFTGSITAIGFVQLVAFGLFWALMVVLLPNLGKI
jgi:hypothetical protein